MINFEGMKAEESKTKFDPLPAGPYIGTIKDARVDGKAPDQSLILRLDVTEGDYAAYFTLRYRHDKDNEGSYPAKYKGDFRIRIPNRDNPNARYPESDKRRFNDAMYRIEQSNPGYRWDGDETKLKGKEIGFSMQDDEYNGNPFTRIARLEIVGDVQKGLVKVMPPRKRREPEVPQGFTQVEDDSEIPF